MLLQGWFEVRHELDVDPLLDMYRVLLSRPKISIVTKVKQVFGLKVCKVIRIRKRVQPDISKARQQVNIDRPAYNKTDKQCRTRTTITARLPDG